MEEGIILKLNRKILIALAAILVVVHIAFISINLIVDDEAASAVGKPYVRFVVTDKVSQPEMDKLIGLAADKTLSEAFNFAVIDGRSDRLQSHIQEYKITGSKATILTDKSGKKVYEKHATLLTKEELVKIAEEYK